MQQASKAIFMTLGLSTACLVSASACKSQSRESRRWRKRGVGGGKEKETLGSNRWLFIGLCCIYYLRVSFSYTSMLGCILSPFCLWHQDAFFLSHPFFLLGWLSPDVCVCVRMYVCVMIEVLAFLYPLSSLKTGQSKKWGENERNYGKFLALVPVGLKKRATGK